MSRTDAPHAWLPRAVVWVFAIPALIVVCVGVVDSHFYLGGNRAFRLRAGLLGVVLLLLTRIVESSCRTRPPGPRSRVSMNRSDAARTKGGTAP